MVEQDKRSFSMAERGRAREGEIKSTFQIVSGSNFLTVKLTTNHLSLSLSNLIVGRQKISPRIKITSAFFLSSSPSPPPPRLPPHSLPITKHQHIEFRWMDSFCRTFFVKPRVETGEVLVHSSFPSATDRSQGSSLYCLLTWFAETS